MIIINCICST